MSAADPASNGHSMGMFRGEIGPSGGCRTASTTPILLRFQWLARFVQWAYSARAAQTCPFRDQNRSQIGVEGTFLIPRTADGNVFDPANGLRERF